MEIRKSKREIIFDKYNGKCAYCGCNLNINNFHIDHIIPKSFGGKRNINNLNPACEICNLSKSNLNIEQFRTKIAEILNKSNNCKIIKKYYKVKPRKILFYFETFGDKNE